MGESHWARLGQNLRPKFQRQITWSQKIDRHAKQFFERILQTSEIKQSCTWHRIDQQIEIATVVILPLQDRAEDTRIACTAAPRELPHGFALVVEGKGRFHG
jgi:hypothetical protein